MSILILVDPNSDEIVYANQEACDYFQCEAQNLISKKMTDFIDDKKDLIKYPTVINNKNYLFVTIHDQKHHLMLTDVFYQSPNAIAILDIYEKVILINQRFIDLFGYSTDALIGNRLDDLIIPDYKLNEIKVNFETVFRGEVVNKETVRKTKTNQLIDVHIIGIPFIIDNEIIGVQVIYEDISEKIRDKHDLQLFKDIIENTSDGIVITDESKCIQHINHAFTMITGYELKEVISKTPQFLKSTFQNKSSIDQLFTKLEGTESVQGEVWIKDKSGHDLLVWLHLFTIKNQDGKVKHYVFSLKNLTELDSVNKKLLLMMQKDPLTSLYNRVYFLDKVQLTSPSYILFLDIDQFKHINDTYGHNVGDEILIEFSKRLLTVFRDHLVSRYGGDEFVVFMNDFNVETLLKQINKLVELLQDDMTIHDEFNIKIKTSIGIAEYPKDGSTIQELLRNADQAMYYAKQNKLAYYFYKNLKDEYNT